MDIRKEADGIINSGTSKEEKVKLLCKLVLEIPYKRIGSINPEDMIREGKGSCTPKHIFLASYLKKLDIPVKFEVILFYYKNQPFIYPEWAKEIVENMPISHHLALKAKFPDKWTLIDVTWDPKLKGFPRNDNWDGVSDMKLGVRPEEIIEMEGDPREYERRRINEFTMEELEARRKFYKMFDEVFLKGR